MSADAVAGLKVFRGKAGCIACHLGPNLTDERFHNTGIGTSDDGRARITGKAEDNGAFKTPSLRQVAMTPPYMHDGSLATLEEVNPRIESDRCREACACDISEVAERNR